MKMYRRDLQGELQEDLASPHRRSGRWPSQQDSRRTQQCAQHQACQWQWRGLSNRQCHCNQLNTHRQLLTSMFFVHVGIVSTIGFSSPDKRKGIERHFEAWSWVNRIIQRIKLWQQCHLLQSTPRIFALFDTCSSTGAISKISGILQCCSVRDSSVMDIQYTHLDIGSLAHLQWCF